MSEWDSVQPKEMVGLTFHSVTGEEDGDLLRFEGDRTFEFYHAQDCCEYVRIADITGDLSDLVGEPILQADEESSDASDDPNVYEEGTWTFYKFATRKGYVTVRWLGESNGYYSESVNMREIQKPEGAESP